MNIKSFFRILLVITFLFSLPLYGEIQKPGKTDSYREPQTNIFFNVIGFGITGRTLTHSGYHFLDHAVIRDIPFVIIPIPGITVLTNSPKIENASLISVGYAAKTQLLPIGISTESSVSLSVTPLLTLSVGVKAATSWNYGTSCQTLGVYSPEKKEYERKTSLTELSYGLTGCAKLTIPLNKYLITQFTYNSEYTGFSGAENGEPWRCNITQNNVNGWKYRATGDFLFLTAGKVIKVIGITYAVDGWYSSSYFDKCYAPYDPTFVTHSVSPMITMQPEKKQSLVIIGNICRERKFENEDYSKSTMLLQHCTGGIWRLTSLACVWAIKLN